MVSCIASVQPVPKEEGTPGIVRTTGMTPPAYSSGWRIWEVESGGFEYSRFTELQPPWL